MQLLTATKQPSRVQLVVVHRSRTQAQVKLTSAFLRRSERRDPLLPDVDPLLLDEGEALEIAEH